MLRVEITKWLMTRGHFCAAIAGTDGWNLGAREGLKAVQDVILKIFIDVGANSYGTNS